MSIKRDETGRDEKGKFVKGYKGGGRKPQSEEFKTLVKEYSVPALRRVIDINQDPESDPKDVLASSKLIIEYAWGKPTQDINSTVQMSSGDFILRINESD